MEKILVTTFGNATGKRRRSNYFEINKTNVEIRNGENYRRAGSLEESVIGETPPYMAKRVK